MGENDSQAITDALVEQQRALAAHSALWTAVTFAGLMVAALLINMLVQKLILKSKMEATLKKFMASIVKVLIMIVAGISGAACLGIPVTSLVALLSVTGLALSLSVQGLLSNLFSGMTLLASKPFVIGDFVEMCGVSGTIREVGMLHTTVAAQDNRVIYIPNVDITGGNIINYTREPKRRLDIVIRASYDSDPERVIEALRDTIGGESRIHKDPEPFIVLSDYKDNGIEYTLRVWTDNSDYWDVSYVVRRAVYESIKKHGAELSRSYLAVEIKGGGDRSGSK